MGGAVEHGQAAVRQRWQEVTGGGLVISGWPDRTWGEDRTAHGSSPISSGSSSAQHTCALHRTGFTRSCFSRARLPGPCHRSPGRPGARADPDGTANTGRRARRRHGPRLVAAHVVGEDRSAPGGQPGHAVGQVAGTAPLDESEQVPQPAQRAPVRASATASRPKATCSSASAMAGGRSGTGRTARRPACQVADHPRRPGQSAAGGWQDEEDARAERCPGPRSASGAAGVPSASLPGSELPKQPPASTAARLPIRRCRPRARARPRTGVPKAIRRPLGAGPRWTR